MTSRGLRTRSVGASAGVVLAMLAFALPSLVAAADFTVNAIPGEGWIQSPDNNAGDAVIVEVRPAALATAASSCTQCRLERLRRDRPSPPRIPCCAHGWQLDDVRHRRHRQHLVGACVASVRTVPGRFAGVHDDDDRAAENGGATANVWQTTTFDRRDQRSGRRTRPATSASSRHPASSATSRPNTRTRTSSGLRWRLEQACPRYTT